MQHYEIVFLVHPDQSAQVPEMIKRYKSIIESSKGKMHRLENWGLRKLAYPINKLNEAHYVLLNIECSQEARKEITDSFHFSDAILRNLILSRECPIIAHSPILKTMEKAKENEKARKLKHKQKTGFTEDADTVKKPILKSNRSDVEQTSKETRDHEEDAVKETENAKQSDDNTNLMEDDVQDTPTENKHVDSTEK